MAAFSLSECCELLSCAETCAEFSAKCALTLGSSALSSASTTESALSRACHSAASSFACSSAAIVPPLSDLHVSQNLRSSSRGTAARTPPGAVISSTSFVSNSPGVPAFCTTGPDAAGWATAAGGADPNEDAGAGEGASPQPPPALPDTWGAAGGPAGCTVAGAEKPPPPPAGFAA